MDRLKLIILWGLFIWPVMAGNYNFTILPSGSYFETIILDPSASQVNASLLAYQFKGRIDRKMHTSINLGITRMLLRWELEKNRGFELGFEYGIHSQFSVEDAGANFLGGLQNSDYRITGVAHYKNKVHTYRMTLFHQSSHLGDDYIIRNDITRPTSNVLNYEQLDFLLSTTKNNFRYYYGLGFNISPNTIRKRLSLQLGYFFNKGLKINKNMGYFYGIDVKTFEQNDFRPGLKIGLGFEIGRNNHNPLRILMEYYKGHLPYSTLEYKQLQSFGIGLYLNSIL
ncbi:MAG: DUF1207 domain-containing protein [Candidatus Neomarinimicrobiota bacterium]